MSYFPMRADVLEIDMREPFIPRVPVMVEAAAEAFNLTAHDILSRRRGKRVATGRMAVYWLARNATPMSLPEIGRMVGKRDHTTVLHGIARCEERREKDSTYRAVTDALLRAVTERITV